MEDILHPTYFVVPKVATSARDLMNPEIGTMVFDITTGSLNICGSKVVGTGAWRVIAHAGA